MATFTLFAGLTYVFVLVLLIDLVIVGLLEGDPTLLLGTTTAASRSHIVIPEKDKKYLCK